MGTKSGIDYVDASWGPWRGCHKTESPGCEHCYAERDMKRYGRDPYRVVRAADNTFNAPLKWKEPKRIFVCPWSDFFIKEADIWRDDALEVMLSAPQHLYIIPTKRPQQALAARNTDGILSNMLILLSVSVQADIDRWEETFSLLAQPTHDVDFPPPMLGISYEPALGSIELEYLDKYDWVVAGGESGPGARYPDLSWFRKLRDDCKAVDVPFYMKQLGGFPDKQHSLPEFPEDLRIRQFPEVE